MERAETTEGAAWLQCRKVARKEYKGEVEVAQSIMLCGRERQGGATIK